MDLYGSCEGEDTLDAYFKRKQADKILEEEQAAKRFKEMDLSTRPGSDFPIVLCGT
jgi:hypothetical protein